MQSKDLRCVDSVVVVVVHGQWNPPRPGTEPTSPALAGRVLTHYAARKVQEWVYVNPKLLI